MGKSISGAAAREPLLIVGTFGCHVLRNPAGTFSYFGTIPEDLRGRVADTRAALVDMLAAWCIMCNDDHARSPELQAAIDAMRVTA